MQFAGSTEAVVEAPAVLIIEDEPILRSSMVRGLSKVESIEVFSAGTLAEASQILERIQPRLVLSDLDLPDGVGVEVLQMLDTHRTHASVVFISAFVDHFSERIPRAGNIEVFEKPLSLHKLREIVEKKLELENSSDALPFALPDYIQMACVGQHSVEVLMHHKGEFYGRIVIHAGQLWSAVDAKGGGKEAVYRMMFAEDLSVQCSALRNEPGPQNITGHWEGILLDAARSFDEDPDNPTFSTGMYSDEFLAAQQSWTELQSADLLPQNEIQDAIATMSENWDSSLDNLETPSSSWMQPPKVESTESTVVPAAAFVEPFGNNVPLKGLDDGAKPASSSILDRSYSTSPREFEYEKAARRLRDYERNLDDPPSSSSQDEVRLGSYANSPTISSLSSSPEQNYTSSYSTTFERLLDDGLEALLSKDYIKAKAIFEEAHRLQPDHPSVTANLKRLHVLIEKEES